MYYYGRGYMKKRKKPSYTKWALSIVEKDVVLSGTNTYNTLHRYAGPSLSHRHSASNNNNNNTFMSDGGYEKGLFVVVTPHGLI